MVPITLNYSQLTVALYELTNVSCLEFNIIMRVNYKLDCECPPICLMDDGNVRFLLLKMDHNRLPIFYSFEETNQERTFEDTFIEHKPMLAAGNTDEPDIFPLIVSIGKTTT